MGTRVLQKPTYIDHDDLVATKSGWCYTKNNNEVIVAIGHLNDRLEALGLDPETGEEIEDEEVDPEDDPDDENPVDPIV